MRCPGLRGSRSARLASAVAVLAAGLVVAPASAQLNQPLHADGWILAAARAPGLHGSIWRTDLWVVADRPNQTITLEFCRSGEDGSAAEPKLLTMSNGDKVAYVEDVVGHFLDVGGASWVGAIHYSAPVGVQVWARVYSISPDGTASYGQLVEGQPTANASPGSNPWDPRDHQWMYALKHTADGRYRVNVGIVNPTPYQSEYWVALNDSTGVRREGMFVDVPPLSMIQLNDPFAAVDGGEWSDYSVFVACSSEECGSFGYASVVDNATNDAFFVPGIKNHVNAFHPEGNCPLHQDGWVLAAARTPGLHGSIWRTDLWIAVPDGNSGTSVDLTFLRSGEDGSDAPVFTVEFEGGKETYYFEDVVDHFLDLGNDGWLGAIRYTSDDTALQVWARIYSVNAAGTASYGQLVHGIPSSDMSPDDQPWNFREHQYLFAMKHSADNRFRVNIGIVNPTEVAANYRLIAYGADFNCPPANCASDSVTVPPFSMVQLGDPFADWQGGAWNAATLVVRCSEEGGGGFAYASVVDNATNDAFFVRAIKLMPPQE